MDEYVTLIQSLLLRKEKECGTLAHLSSRFSQENIAYINGIREEVAAICKSVNLPIEQNNLQANPRCISAYKYLALNTNFRCLDLLSQDTGNSHLVDICPLLSPYLFIEIIWHLHYEDLLVESLLYLPLDLVVEIVEIARRCIDMLHFDRALRFITKLALRCHQKLALIQLNGAQSSNLTIHLESLVLSIQEILAIFTSETFLRLEDLEDSQKYARTGLVLKNLLDLTIGCFSQVSEPLNPSLEKHYKVTFGHEPIQCCDPEIMQRHLETLCNELLTLLMRKVKEINCFCYIEWTEFDDIENPSISLQKAVGLRCHRMMALLRSNESLQGNEHLAECLQLISSEPEKETEVASLCLEEVLTGAKEGREDCVGELFNRCRTWTEDTFNEVKKLCVEPSERTCLLLLDYLVFLKSDPNPESFVRKIHLYTTGLMLHLELSRFVKTVVAFILKYDGSGILECPNTETCFRDFIDRNPNFELEKDWKQAFLFLLKNVRKYIAFFIRAFLGHSAFKNTMLPMQELLHFAPYLVIKDNENNYLVLAALREILMEEGAPLHPQTINSMLTLILTSTCIEKHDLVNMAFTPYLLYNRYPQTHLMLVLQQLKNLWKGIEYAKVDLSSLYQGLTKKLYLARKDTSGLRETNCHIITRIKGFFAIYPSRLELRMEEKAQILLHVEPFLEPIDRCFFIDTCLNWLLLPTQDYIIRDYERRFLCAKHRILNSDRIQEYLKSHVVDFGLLVEDFIRHAVIHSNSDEYIEEGFSILKGDWRFLNWHNHLHAYTQFCRITMEACQLCLEYPTDFASGTAFVLIEFLANFLEFTFRSFGTFMIPEEYCSTFVRGIASLADSMSGTPFAEPHRHLVIQLNNTLATSGSDNFCGLYDLCQIVKQYTRKFTESSGERRYDFAKPHSAMVTRFRLAYHIVNASMMVTNGDVTDCLERAHQCLVGF